MACGGGWKRFMWAYVLCSIGGEGGGGWGEVVYIRPGKEMMFILDLFFKVCVFLNIFY